MAKKTATTKISEKTVIEAMANLEKLAKDYIGQAKNEIKASQKTGFVSSKFSDFTFTSYLTLLIIIGCLLYSLVNIFLINCGSFPKFNNNPTSISVAFR